MLRILPGLQAAFRISQLPPIAQLGFFHTIWTGFLGLIDAVHFFVFDGAASTADIASLYAKYLSAMRQSRAFEDVELRFTMPTMIGDTALMPSR